MEASPPTLRDMAKRLNISVSTVSRGLIGHPRISLRMRLKVQQMAKELGYEPNSLAVSFKSKKTFNIGVIVPSVREEFFSSAICGIEDIAAKSNYAILFGQSYDDIDNEIRLVDQMKKQRVDGLIISLSKATLHTHHIDTLSKLNIPVVYFDRVPAYDSANRIYCNLKDGAKELVGKLLNDGVRRIAMINGPDKLAASKDGLNGYIEAMAKFKLKVDMRLVEQTDFSAQRTYIAMRRIMSLNPQAIISFNDYVHMDAIQYAMQQNVKINDEVIFASFAKMNITNYTMHRPLMALEQYPYKQGESAMKMLLQVINNKSKTAEGPLYGQLEVVCPSLIQLS
jgi:DNA-binding LacI/PurR family transcriptional regulator